MARYPKGSKNNIAPSTTAPKVVEKSASVTSDTKAGKILATMTTTSIVPQLPVEQASNTLSTYKWQPFGSDNLFPQAIAQLTRKSPTHRGIINWKNTYITGAGFQTEDKELMAWIESCNSFKQSLQAVCDRIEFDILSAGNGYLELVYHAKTNVLSVFHRDHTTCRISADGKNVLIYGDWANIYKAKETDIVSLPLYPQFNTVDEDGFSRAIYHFKDYEPEFKYYGIPSSIAAMDAAAIAYKTNKWNVSRLDNDFAGSGTLVVEGDISPKQAKEMKKDFKSTYTGEGKTGKVLFIVKQLGGGKTEFVQTNKVSEGDWLQLHKQSTEDLLISHTWFPSLSGSVSSGGLGGNIQQIRTEYQIALSKVIKKQQKKLLDPIKKIIALTNKLNTDDLAFINESPVEMFDIEMESIMTVGEARKLKGLLVDDTDPTMKLYVSQNKSNTAQRNGAPTNNTEARK